MDRVVELTEVVAHEVAEYVAWGMHDADVYLMRDDVRRAYAFVSVPHDHLKLPLVVMLARVSDDNLVIIETDRTDKPLYQSLIDLGVPRSLIIRAYAGKTEPEP